MSSRTQATTETFTQNLARTLNATGQVKTEQTGYQKGFAGSTQTMTVTWQPERHVKPLRLLVTNHIHHGPFPGLRAVGQAAIDTDIRFEDPQLQAQLDKALGGQKVTMHTLVGLGGDTHSTLNVPSGQWQDGAGGLLSWQALGGHINVKGNTTESDLNWPGLKIAGNGEGSGEITGISLHSRQQKSENAALGAGGGTLKIARLNFSGVNQGKAVQLQAQDIEVGSDSKATQGFWDVTSRYNIGLLSSGDLKLNQVQLHLGFRHLAAAPLEALSRQMQELQKQSGSGAASGLSNLSEAQTKGLQDQVMALLKGQPRLTLDRLSLIPGGAPGNSTGAVVITGEMSAPKLAQFGADELQLLAAQQPAALLGVFKIHLDAQASKTALAELSRMEQEGGGGAAVTNTLESNLQPLLDRGYLSAQGDHLHTTFDFVDGQALMNGKPLQR